MATGSAGGGGAGAGGGGAGGPRASNSSLNPYAVLNREHQAGRERRGSELEALKALRGRTQNLHDSGKSPASVVGNEWAARARAAEHIKQTTMYGKWPQMTPSGVVLSVPARNALDQGAARAKDAGIDASVAAKKQSTPEVRNALRVDVATLWEKSPGTVAETAKRSQETSRVRDAGSTLYFNVSRTEIRPTEVLQNVASKVTSSPRVVAAEAAAVDKATRERKANALSASKSTPARAKDDVDLGMDGG